MLARANRDRSALERQPESTVSTELTAKYFRALGDATRLRILELLIERPRTVTELTKELQCPQSRVSNHLACLRWCGFVTSQSEGKWTHYEIADEKVCEIVALGRQLVATNAELIAACTRIAPSL